MTFGCEQKLRSQVLCALGSDDLFRLLADSEVDVVMKMLGLLRNLLSSRSVSRCQWWVNDCWGMFSSAWYYLLCDILSLLLGELLFLKLLVLCYNSFLGCISTETILWYRNGVDNTVEKNRLRILNVLVAVSQFNRSMHHYERACSTAKTSVSREANFMPDL